MVIRSRPAPQRIDVFQLAGLPSSVRTARGLATRTLTGWGIGGEAADSAIVSLSEFVTNAVVHGCPAVPGTTFPQLAGLGLIEVRLKQFPAFLAVEVWDPDQPPAGHGRTVPRRLTQVPGQESGRGLEIVNRLASRWGVLPEPVGKTVYALFDLIPQPAHSAAGA